MKPRKNTLDERATELKSRLINSGLETVGLGTEATYTLNRAALKIGVSYSTARRLLRDDPDVQRYSCTTGQEVVFPGMKLRKHQRVRMTWIIPESSIQRAKLKMRVHSPIAA